MLTPGSNQSQPMAAKSPYMQNRESTGQSVKTDEQLDLKSKTKLPQATTGSRVAEPEGFASRAASITSSEEEGDLFENEKASFSNSEAQRKALAEKRKSIKDARKKKKVPEEKIPLRPF